MKIKKLVISAFGPYAERQELNFEENPKLKIKNIECEVNSDAPTVLKIMQLLGDGQNVTAGTVLQMYELIFNENDRKKIEKLKLNFIDFRTVVMSAINVVTGNEPEGE